MRRETVTHTTVRLLPDSREEQHQLEKQYKDCRLDHDFDGEHHFGSLVVYQNTAEEIVQLEAERTTLALGALKLMQGGL